MSRFLIVVSISLFFSKGVAANEKPLFQIPRTEVISIQDTNSNRMYELYIKLPSGYSTSHNQNTRYPVVYLTDAANNFQIVSGSTNFPMNNNKIESAIIVGISWQKGLPPQNSRVRDYTPTKANNWKRETGGAGTHLTFIRNEVIKHIESNYRADPNKRTYFGYSLGGLFGAYVLLTQPDTFSNCILGSPSLWFDNKYIFELESKTAKKIKDLDANVFISIGDLETPKMSGTNNNMVTQAQEFYSNLESRNYESLSLKLLVVDSADHETALPTAIIRGLYWMFER